MKSTLAITLLLASGLSCANEWTLIGKSDSISLFMNKSTITTIDTISGSYLQGWIRQYSNPPVTYGAKKYDTTDTLYVIDCINNEWAIRSSIMRFKNKVVDTATIEKNLISFQPAAPDTTAAFITAIICK